MQEPKHVSIIKFMPLQLQDSSVFFYPCTSVAWSTAKETDPNLIDEANIKILFDYLGYTESLMSFMQKYRIFGKGEGASYWKLKYKKMNQYYKLLADFILKLTFNFYYENYFQALGATNPVLETSLDYNFDQAFGNALEIEKKLRTEFWALLEKELPDPHYDDKFSVKLSKK